MSKKTCLGLENTRGRNKNFTSIKCLELEDNNIYIYIRESFWFWRTINFSRFVYEIGVLWFSVNSVFNTPVTSRMRAYVDVSEIYWDGKYKMYASMQERITTILLSTSFEAHHMQKQLLNRKSKMSTCVT